MKRLRCMMAVSLALLMWGGAKMTADTPLVLKGRVTDENGLPIGGAQVKLEPAGGPAVSGRSGQAVPVNSNPSPPASAGQATPPSAVAVPPSTSPQTAPAGAGQAPGVGGAPTAPTNSGQASTGAAQTSQPSAGPVLTTATDDAGYFSFPNLSPGDYLVRIEKQGFFVLENQKIQLTAATTEFAFVLNHEEEVREKVDVTATENRIEPTTMQSTESLSSSEIRDIPVPSSHDLQQSLAAMPQVLIDNDDLIHIAGSRNTTAQYLIDGVEVGDPASNALDARMIVEAVRSTEIQTSRFGAEYAHPGAAVLSYETREGDDKWRFNAVDFFPGIRVQNGLEFGNYYPRFEFSGPIVKDTLWFSQSFDVIHTLAIINGLAPGQPDQSQEWGGDSWSRLLWKISTNNSLHVSFLANEEDDTNLGLSALNPQPTTTNATTSRLFGFVKEQSYIHKTLFEVGVGVERTTVDSNPQGDQPYIQLVNSAKGNYFEKSTQDAARYQFFTDAIGAPKHWLGKHTLSAGANLSSVDMTQTATRTEIQALRENNTLERLTTFTGSPDFHVANTLAGGFVQDSWSPNDHVVLQAGVRADWDRLFHAALAQPRVSMNWMPFKNDRAKFSIGWGMYDIPLNLTVIGQAYDQQEVDTLYDLTGKVVIAGPATSAFILPAAGLQSLQQPYFDIASAGWQERIGDNTLVSLELLGRDEHHGLVWETLTPGQIGSDFLLQTTREDKYRGVTVTARHTFKNTTVLFGSYTRSKATTNEVLDPELGSMYFAAQQPGPLSWDAPNRFLSWGTIPTPIWGILLVYLFDFRTGYPYSNINQEQFLVGVADGQRFPDYASLTIGLEKKFTFRNRIFAARVSGINILNRLNPDVVVNNVEAPNFGAFTGGQGRAFTLRLRFVGKK